MGPQFSTEALGMGTRFVGANCPLIDSLDALCREFGRKTAAEATAAKPGLADTR